MKIKNMIMIGSTGRNSGKTTLACDLIEKLKDYTTTALKVTTVKDRHKCQRGQEGCGVCSSLKGSFQLDEDFSENKEKDTAKMRRAGAKKVYWLRATKEGLEDGIKAFIKEIEESDYIVCESNSLRKIVEPMTFIMIDNAQKPKESALDVIDKADIIIKEYTGLTEEILDRIGGKNV